MPRPTSKRASFGSPLTNMRPPSPWRPDARPRLADLGSARQPEPSAHVLNDPTCYHFRVLDPRLPLRFRRALPRGVWRSLELAWAQRTRARFSQAQDLRADDPSRRDEAWLLKLRWEPRCGSSARQAVPAT